MFLRITLLTLSLFFVSHSNAQPIAKTTGANPAYVLNSLMDQGVPRLCVLKYVELVTLPAEAYGDASHETKVIMLEAESQVKVYLETVGYSLDGYEFGSVAYFQSSGKSHLKSRGVWVFARHENDPVKNLEYQVLLNLEEEGLTLLKFDQVSLNGETTSEWFCSR